MAGHGAMRIDGADCSEGAPGKSLRKESFKKADDRIAKTARFDLRYRETVSSRSSIRSKTNEFKKKVLAPPGFREPRNTGPKVPVDPRLSGYTVRDFLDDGEYLNAYEFATRRRPLMFGYGGNNERWNLEPVCRMLPTDVRWNC